MRKDYRLPPSFDRERNDGGVCQGALARFVPPWRARAGGRGCPEWRIREGETKPRGAGLARAGRIHWASRIGLCETAAAHRRSTALRRDDTRRKILMGAIVLAKVEQGCFRNRCYGAGQTKRSSGQASERFLGYECLVRGTGPIALPRVSAAFCLLEFPKAREPAKTVRHANTRPGGSPTIGFRFGGQGGCVTDTFKLLAAELEFVRVGHILYFRAEWSKGAGHVNCVAAESSPIFTAEQPIRIAYLYRE